MKSFYVSRARLTISDTERTAKSGAKISVVVVSKKKWSLENGRTVETMYKSQRWRRRRWRPREMSLVQIRFLFGARRKTTLGSWVKIYRKARQDLPTSLIKYRGTNLTEYGFNSFVDKLDVLFFSSCLDPTILYRLCVTSNAKGRRFSYWLRYPMHLRNLISSELSASSFKLQTDAIERTADWSIASWKKLRNVQWYLWNKWKCECSIENNEQTKPEDVWSVVCCGNSLFPL